MALYQAQPDRNFRRAIGETPYQTLGNVRVDTRRPNSLDLYQSGQRFDTQALAPIFYSEIVSLGAGELARRSRRVVTETASYDELRTYMGFGAGEQVVDVTDVLNGTSPIAFLADLNVASSESATSGFQGLETDQVVQQEQTVKSAEQSGDAPEIVFDDVELAEDVPTEAEIEQFFEDFLDPLSGFLPGGGLRDVIGVQRPFTGLRAP